MPDTSANNKRIAKNTIALYFRMIITMIVGLFTSRVILDSLGVQDYGIYNLVGGFVTMFNVFRAGLISATQRFITFDLGKGDMKELRGTFSTSFIIFLFISALIVILAEAIAPWFISNKLTIPVDRVIAANWVFQFSLVTLVLNLISSPYNALIIAHEKMKTFAYISIFEVVAKLLIAYVIYVSPFDKLIVYGFLLCFVQFMVRIIYTSYCNKNFEESKILWKIDWQKVKMIYAFTGWEFIGAAAVIGANQGLSVLLGMFFNPVVNAAHGVAVQIQHVITGFVTNFQTALNPQITKSYAANNKGYMFKLIFASSRLSYFLLLFISLPVVLETDILLNLWLVKVPEYTALFFRIIIICSMIDAISNPISTSVEATGNIRNFQIVVGLTRLMIIPITYLVLKIGGSPTAAFIVLLIINILALIERIVVGSKTVGFSSANFLNSVIAKLVTVSLFASVLPVCLHYYMTEGLIRLLIVGFVSCITSGISIYYVGLSDSEREIILKPILRRFKKYDK